MSSVADEGIQKWEIVVFLAVLIALSAISISTFMRIRHVMEGEERLVFASLAAIPFIVRIIYSTIVDFDRSSTTFSLTSDRNAAIVVQATMSVAMEFTVALIFLVAGFAAPAIPRSILHCREGSYNGTMAD
jgi:hypothetical protein